MTSLYTIRTWALAHALHPIVWIVYIYLWRSDENQAMLAFLACIIGFFASIPLLYLCWGIVDVIVNSTLSLTLKYWVWIVCAPVFSYISLLLLCWVFTSVVITEYFFSMIEYTGPAMISIVLSILIRFPQFIKLNKEINVIV